MEENEVTPTANVADKPVPPELEAEKKLVGMKIKKIKADKKHFAPAFKRMRENMDLAFYGADKKEWNPEKKYTAPIVQRHVNQSVATLYAKNPTMKVTRRKRMDHAIWDGSIEEFQMATQQAQLAVMSNQPVAPEAEAVLADVEQAQAQRKVIDNVCRTLELLLDHSLDENRFKAQMKQCVRRAKTTAIGWCRVGYQRKMDKRPETRQRINDITTQAAKIEQLQAKLSAEDATSRADYEAEQEELRLAMEQLQSEPEIVVREGLVYSFPKSTAVIPDKDTTDLRGLTDCGHLSEEFSYTVDEIQEIFGVNLKDEGWGYAPYKVNAATGEAKEQKTGSSSSGDEPEDEKCAVWQHFDRSTGLVYTLCDGCPRFLEPPKAPNVKLERFFVHFGLTFNEVEHEGELFPPSDVQLIRHMQMETNRAREDLRQHRYANRPAWLSPAGSLEEKDKKNLKDYNPHDIIFLIGLATGQKAEDILQRMPTVPIDQNAYTVQPMIEDVLRVVGSQEANLGPTSGATATESSIAETSRVSAANSNVDDLDQFLEDIARASAQVLLINMEEDTVKRIVGDGAAWPQATVQQIQEEIYATIEAGSSGRPNQAQEVANFERMVPLLIQVPGISPKWLAKEAIRRLNDSADIDEALMEGAPSIVSMNQQKQPGTGDPGTDPNAQGGEGGQNAPTQPGQAQGPQPAMPAPAGAANQSTPQGKRVA